MKNTVVIANIEHKIGAHGYPFMKVNGNWQRSQKSAVEIEAALKIKKLEKHLKKEPKQESGRKRTARLAAMSTQEKLEHKKNIQNKKEIKKLARYERIITYMKMGKTLREICSELGTVYSTIKRACIALNYPYDTKIHNRLVKRIKQENGK